MNNSYGQCYYDFLEHHSVPRGILYYREVVVLELTLAGDTLLVLLYTGYFRWSHGVSPVPDKAEPPMLVQRLEVGLGCRLMGQCKWVLSTERSDPLCSSYK